MMVSPKEAVTEGLDVSLQDILVYFYVDDGLVASPRPERLQKLFDVLSDLFNRVGLQKI